MKEKKRMNKGKKIVVTIVTSICFLVVIGLAVSYLSFRILYSNLEREISEYSEVVKNYNAVSEEYQKIKLVTSIENLKNMPEVKIRKTDLENGISFWDFLQNKISKDSIGQEIKKTVQETDELLYALIIAQQITNPTEEWIVERLKNIDEIDDIQTVKKNKDPNHKLGVEGGYTACVYFSVKNIREDSVKGDDIVEKGTDVGGSIEVFATVKDAQNRCDYLKQFDNTLLYSGSYAIVGTVVIRTSYQLTNKQQIELTNKITTEFTAVK